ncbi:hypothetical protein CWC18_12025 [Pseudoalteromonas aurantia]|uniref:helix-turn-helix transcriptional regulator n=1 Tax=Pseudoalteromonas aurantia TaxID=43654 RepID=UPI00110B902B|nr:helix-turn-helix transcriptional regulator [Pseudoalteromonas aurantia]TMO61240.1 hypothetical protein CWC18_12025 [Pseudoalteromonas aurantia]
MLDGNDLKSVRKNAGISQTDMAKKLDCDRRTIINYEQGVCEPKASQLFRWLSVCKIDLKPLAAQVRSTKESLFLLFTLTIISPYIASVFYVGTLSSCALYGAIRKQKSILQISLIAITLYTLEFNSLSYFEAFLSNLINDQLKVSVIYYMFQIAFSILGYSIFTYIIKKNHWHYAENPRLSNLVRVIPLIYIYFATIVTLHLIDFYIDEKYNYTFLSVFYTHYENLIYIGMSLIIFTLVAMVVSHEKELKRAV